VYPGAGSVAGFPDNVERGDLVEITGTLKDYNGLLEIDPVTSYDVISSGNPLPAALVTTPAGIGEETESELIQINGVNFTAGGNLFSVGNYEFTANGESSEIYVRTGHSLIGTEIPLAAVNLTGISSQFNSIYQLLPRDGNDLEIADDFYLTSAPAQTNLSTSGFTVSWETNVASNSTVRYGTTTTDLDQMIEAADLTTNHSLDVTGLEPATFYYVEVSSDNGTSAVTSTQQIYSTASTSSGTMKIYFNGGVDPNYSTGSFPTGTTGAAIEGEIINRINAAQTSIDCSIYNINRTTIVAALTAAYERGVIVRYVADNETGNVALQNPTPPFPVLRGNADGLMHNKFFVFDADDNDNSWVMSGSTNMTDNNIADDYNNTVFIQDKALAQAYTLEFEEMWGTDGPSPGVFTVLFGADKTNNTPHTFLINGIIMESYFSPSDNTTIAIAKAIESADTDLEFALLVFTNNELGAAVLSEHNSGVAVRGIVDMPNSTGSEFDFLVNNGVNVTEDNTTISTHHKYCIVDATDVNSDPQVVLGSHNWSAGAENSNDENTLIVHDATVANIYLQEFEARWCESQGGQDCVTTDVDELNAIEGVALEIYPNPARTTTTVHVNLAEKENLVLNLLDFRGVFLQSIVVNNVQGNYTESLDVQSLPAGQYIIQLQIGNEQMSRIIQVVK
jgi:phosphatidylserine/phosphatidylglycerophosphate/cardiolipin synthase-like enzyme